MLRLSVLITILLFVLSCERTSDNGKCEGNFSLKNGVRCWSEKAPNAYPYDVAKTYCANLGGRLPTISELRTLIQNCAPTEADGACKVTDDCLSMSCFDQCAGDGCGCSYDKNKPGQYSIFGDDAMLWSSSAISGVDFGYFYAYFAEGWVTYMDNQGFPLEVRCTK